MNILENAGPLHPRGVSTRLRASRLRFVLFAAVLLFGACDTSTSPTGTNPVDPSSPADPGSPVDPDNPAGPPYTGPNYGYANPTLRYFYYTGDNKIYYMSRNSVYKMDIDGKNSVKVRSNTPQDTADRKYKYQYIYVSNGIVYYNDRVSNKTYKMRTDGTGHEPARDGKSGPMGTYGIGAGEVLYFDRWKRYLKGNTLYFSALSDFRNLSRKTPPDSGTTVTLVNALGDGFVFAPDGIYFRLHIRAGGRTAGYYGIVRVDYSFTPQVTWRGTHPNDADMKEIAAPGPGGRDAAGQVEWDYSGSGDYFNVLNVSRDFIAYVRRGVNYSGDRLTGLNVVHRGSGVSRSPQTVHDTLEISHLAGGINIIDDYVYWLTDNGVSTRRYKLHRVKKDGTGYGVVKEMPY